MVIHDVYEKQQLMVLQLLWCWLTEFKPVKKWFGFESYIVFPPNRTVFCERGIWFHLSFPMGNTFRPLEIVLLYYYNLKACSRLKEQEYRRKTHDTLCYTHQHRSRRTQSVGLMNNSLGFAIAFIQWKTGFYLRQRFFLSGWPFQSTINRCNMLLI